MELRRADVAWAGGVAVVYFVAAKLGLTLATVGGTVTLVWPPSGVAVAAMLLCGRRVWPGVAIGAFLANATTDADHRRVVHGSGQSPGGRGCSLASESRARLRSVARERARRRCPGAPWRGRGSGGERNDRRVGARRRWNRGSARSPGSLVHLVGRRRDGNSARDAAHSHLVHSATSRRVGSASPRSSVPRCDHVHRKLSRVRRAAAGRVTAPLMYVALALLIWAAFSFEQRGAATAAVVISALAVRKRGLTRATRRRSRCQ